MKLCPGNGNGKACKAMNTERARMGPYMKDLERLLGYRSLKAKFSRMGNMEEAVLDEEETEVSFKTIYKSPIVEKDEMIKALVKEKEQLGKELPILKEDLTKVKSQLSAVQKSVKQKSKQINQASSITEKRLAEAISLDPSYLKDNPHLVTLLAIFQERDDFDVDTENEIVKPVHEETFLKETEKNVMDLTSQQTEILPDHVEQCKERLGHVKNQLLDSVKQRWIRPERRNSICSIASSTGSKRDRSEVSPDRSNRQRTTSPIH